MTLDAIYKLDEEFVREATEETWKKIIKDIIRRKRQIQASWSFKLLFKEEMTQKPHTSDQQKHFGEGDRL